MARNKSTTVTVNMKGVEGKGARIKPGEYLGEVEEVSKEKGDNPAGYLKWTFGLDDGGKAYFNTSLAKNALWNLRGLLEAMGEDVPDDEMDIDLSEMEGKRVGIVMEEEVWEGKKRVKMVDYFPEDEKSESNDDDAKKDKKKKKKDKDEDDGDDVVEDKKDKKKKKGKKDEPEKVSREAVEDMDEEELTDLVKDKELEVDLDDFKTLKKKTKAVLEELDEKDLLED